MTINVENWSQPNEFLNIWLHSALQCTRISRISRSKTVWIMRYCNFWNDNFVDFPNYHHFNVINPPTFITNHARIPKSGTMLLSFSLWLKVNTIWKLLRGNLDWISLNEQNGTIESFFYKNLTFVVGLH